MANTKTLVKYWRKLADEKWKTAEGLMKLKRYSDALFFCHLVLEAELKAVVVIKIGDNAPFIHQLVRLAKLAKLPVSKEQFADLKEITTFNVEGRYSEYKLAIYKKATKPFAEKYFEIVKDLRSWIKKNSQPEK